MSTAANTVRRDQVYNLTDINRFRMGVHACI